MHICSSKLLILKISQILQEAATEAVMYEKVFLEILQNLQALRVQLYLTQVSPCEFYKISKNTFLTE